ncbi:MAG TPA: tetratricopeptide repeat protein [Balneolaceae bacterium]|nr:tetratricopeptide repeat protein [Balneolaceae bacterium]
MSKKRVQQELEHDILLETFSRAQSIYDNNKKLVIGTALALVLIIGGSVGYYFYHNSQEQKAEQLMGQATEAYLNADYKKALNGSDEDFTVGFEQIINNYSGTEAANLARYYAAVCEYNLGDNNKALNYINEYETPEGIMGVAPLSFKAMLLSNLGKYTESANTYVKAAEWKENDSTTPYNYLEAANAFQEAGKTSEAKKYANKIVDNYPSSSQVTEAQKLLGTLAIAQ